MLECWSAGMLEWGIGFSVGEALGVWRWALGGMRAWEGTAFDYCRGQILA